VTTLLRWRNGPSRRSCGGWAEPVGASLQLPEARIVWLKGQLIRQWEAQRKMLRPVEVMAPFERRLMF
jgi:hypothetical protein